jgi:hypothetical protein
MNTFHHKMHELLIDRMKELGVNVVLGERAKIPADNFAGLNGKEFEISLQSGRKLSADFAVRPYNSILYLFLQALSDCCNGSDAIIRSHTLTFARKHHAEWFYLRQAHTANNG